jgi:hypothetical protein
MGEFAVEGERRVYIGARRLCCCKADDFPARVKVIEKLTFSLPTADLRREMTGKNRVSARA